MKYIDIMSLPSEDRVEMLNEAKILETLNHPNIVRYRDVFMTEEDMLCIVMDYIDDGDLQGKIEQRAKTVDGQGRKNYMSTEELLS